MALIEGTRLTSQQRRRGGVQGTNPAKTRAQRQRQERLRAEIAQAQALQARARSQPHTAPAASEPAVPTVGAGRQRQYAQPLPAIPHQGNIGPSIVQAVQAALNAAPGRLPGDRAVSQAAFAGPGGDIAHNAVTDVQNITLGFPKFAYHLGQAGYETVRHPTHGLAPLYEAAVAPQVAYYQQKYIDPYTKPGGGGTSQLIENLKQTPVLTASDILGLGGLVAGTGVRLGRFGAARAEGAGLGEAAAATRRMRPEELRTLGYNKASVRPATSPSAFTRYMQKRWDVFSERHPEMRVVGARERVARRGAQELIRETERIRGGRASDIHAIRSIGGPAEGFLSLGGVRGRPARIKFAYDLELPDAAKGGEGMRRVALDLGQEQRYWREKRIPEIDAEIARIKSEQVSGVVDRKEEQALKELHAEREHAANVITSLETRVREIKQALASPRTYDPAALEAARRMNQESEDIARWAGLSEESAANRPGLLARRLGYQDTSGAEYFQHTATASTKAQQRLGVVRFGGGKSRLPSELTHENRLILYQQGRELRDPDVVIQHWQRMQHYKGIQIAKDFLAALGEPIEGKPNPGWIIVNRNGEKLPRHWKDMPAAERLVAEGFNPETILTEDVPDLISNTFAEAGTKEGRDLLKRSAPEDVVQVSPQAYRQFFDSFVGSQGTGGKTGGAVRKGVDALNDMVRFALIYSNPAYIPPNLANNLIFVTIQQGWAAPANIARAIKAVAKPGEFRDRLLSEAGHGPAMALPSGAGSLPSRATKAVARVQGAGADVIPRAAAWIHEARKQNYKTEADQLRLLTDPKLRDELNHVKDLEEDAMVRFSGLSPFEKQWVNRLIFVYPWVRGVSRWVIRQPLDRPARTAYIEHGSVEAQQTSPSQGPLPDYLKQIIPTGGGKFINPATTSQFTTPFDVLQTLQGVASAKPVRPLTNLVNPLLSTVGYSLAGIPLYGGEPGEPTGALRAAAHNFPAELTPSIVTLASELVSPPKSPLYGKPGTGKQTRADILRRRLGRGLIPQHINLDVAHQRARQQGQKPSDLDLMVGLLQEGETPERLPKLMAELYGKQVSAEQVHEAELAALETAVGR